MKEALSDYDYYSNSPWKFKTSGPASSTDSTSTEQSDKPSGGFTGFKMGSKRDQPAS